MKLSRDERGSLNGLLIPLILSIVFLLGAIGFGGWAFMERTDYKNNADQKAEAASKVAVIKAQSEKDNEFIEKEKEPLKTYSSLAQYGSFSFQYPKTWSVYSVEQNNQLTLLLQTDVVSSNPKTAYALRVEVVNTPYAQTITGLDALVKQSKVSGSAFALAKVPDAVGMRFNGQVSNDKTGAAVYLPLRDKTLKITTESPERVGDFDKLILPNFEFKP